MPPGFTGTSRHRTDRESGAEFGVCAFTKTYRWSALSSLAKAELINSTSSKRWIFCKLPGESFLRGTRGRP